jgi:hypothetical protein
VRGKLHVLERDQRQDTDDGLSFEESLNYSHFHGAYKPSGHLHFRAKPTAFDHK